MTTQTTATVYASQPNLSLYPPIIEITTIPDTTVTTPITITNNSDSNQTISFDVKMFLPEDDDGSMSFVENNRVSALKQMVKIEKNGDLVNDSFTLRPNEKSELTLTVTVPKEASLGSILDSDSYLTALFQTQNNVELSQSGSKVETGLGTHILLSINAPDNSKRSEAILKEFRTHKFFLDQPIDFILRVENKGKHFLKAGGEIRIFDTQGHQIKTIPVSKQNVLAESIRNLVGDHQPIPSQGLFGKYHAQATIDIGEGKILQESITFYVIPEKPAKISLLLLLAITIIVLRYWYYLKKRKPPTSMNKKIKTVRQKIKKIQTKQI